MNEEGRAIRHVQLMTDWTLPPVYVGTGDGRLDLTDSDELIDLFGVPQQVVDAIECWYARLRSVLDMDDPKATRFERLHENGFYEAGRRAAALLRRHLPAHVVIEYRGNDDIPSEFF